MLSPIWKNIGINQAWQGKFNRKVDLHFHSRYSDGSKQITLPEIVNLAQFYGLAAIALTDHDTIQGLRELRQLTQDSSVALITGVEISCSIASGPELHTLGYGFDLENKKLRIALAELQHKMIERFNNFVIWINTNLRNYQLEQVPTHTFPRIIGTGETAITPEETRQIVQAQAGNTFGRPHLAQLLLEKGFFPLREKVGDRPGAPAFRFLSPATRVFPAPTIELGKAIDLLHQAGGLAFMAHPFGNERSPKEIAQMNRVKPEEYITNLLSSYPYDGLELVHSEHSDKQQEFLRTLAEQNSLLISGGSDTHWKENDTRIFGLSPTRALALQAWMKRCSLT